MLIRPRSEGRSQARHRPLHRRLLQPSRRHSALDFSSPAKFGQLAGELTKMLSTNVEQVQTTISKRKALTFALARVPVLAYGPDGLVVGTTDGDRLAVCVG